METIFIDSYRTDLEDYDYCGNDYRQEDAERFRKEMEETDMKAAELYFLFSCKGEIKF